MVRVLCLLLFLVVDDRSAQKVCLGVAFVLLVVGLALMVVAIVYVWVWQVR